METRYNNTKTADCKIGMEWIIPFYIEVVHEFIIFYLQKGNINCN